jgi:3-oxoadipate enol-lactonase
MTIPHYAELGTGDTAVFLLHGVGGGQGAWAHTLPVLARQGYRAVAWDASGYGGSAPVAPCTTTALAQSLHQLVAHIGASRNVLLGHSMGGMIAQEAFALQPDTIHGLILFATSPAFGKPGGDWQQQFLQSRFAPLDAGAGMAGLAPELVRSMFAPGARASVMASAVDLMSRVPEATYRAALSAIVSFNRLDNLPRIDVPTLCLACELDKNAAPVVMEKMAARIPNAQYTCLLGVGHLGSMEQPEAFNTAVLQFLKQHFPTQGSSQGGT